MKIKFYFIIIYSLAIFSLFFLVSFPTPIRLSLLFALIIYSIYLIDYSRKNKILQLRLKPDDSFELVTSDDRLYSGSLYGECIVTRFLVWLNFSVTADNIKYKHFHLLLLTDSAESEVLRQLRVRLRLMRKNNDVMNFSE
ncbi:MAG: hypothetical protein OEW97_03810 [Gammaproteobacteria bacterium]|nr:hypothetical protein [Gammaproteobacteria bacterium]